MNSRSGLFLRAIRGPVVLIVVGVLALWQQAGWVSLEHTWPLILIVIGILRLLERLAGPALQASLPLPPPGGFRQ